MYRIYVGSNLIYPVDSDTEDYTVINPHLDIETNKAESLEFTLPPDHPAWNGLEEMLTYVSVWNDNECFFYGRVLSAERDFDNCITYHCEGALGFLNDTVVGKVSSTSQTPADRLNGILTAHNNIVDDARKLYYGGSKMNTTVKISNPDYCQRMDFLMNLVEAHGGNISTRYVYDDDNDIIKPYLFWYKDSDLDLNHAIGLKYSYEHSNGNTYEDYPPRNAQPITFARNILDLSSKADKSEIYTYCLALGRKSSGSRITLSNYSGTATVVGTGGSGETYYTNSSGDYRAYAIATNAAAEYGRICKVVTFDKATSASDLFDRAVEEMEKVIYGSASEYEVSAIDLISGGLTDYDHIRVGDLYCITSEAHDIEENLVCTRAEIDLASPDQSRYTFGGKPLKLSGMTAASMNDLRRIGIADDE